MSFSPLRSLVELEHCVIRGKLSQPHSGRSLSVEPTKSSEAFKRYALGNVDARVNFILHNGLTSCHPEVPILKASIPLSRQMNDISTAYIQNSIQIDGKRKTVTLPEVCKVYRDDFGDDSVGVLKYLLRFLEKGSWTR